MDRFILAVTLFTGLSTVFAGWSVALCRKCLAERRFPVRRLNELEVAVADLVDRQERTHQFVKKVNAREAMRTAREKRHEDKPEGNGVDFDQHRDETPEQWKARMRRELAARTFGGQ